MSGQWHPDTEAIASLQAGLTSGFRARRVAAHVARCARCAAVSDQLSAASSMLASVPVPALPDTFERQISAAIAAEAAARAGAAGVSPAGAGPADRNDQERDLAEPAWRRPRPERSRTARGFRFRPAMAFVPAVAVVLAGFGYLVSSISPSGSSFSEPDAAASPEISASASAPAAAGRAPQAEPAHSSALPFLIIVSGTRYQASTLRAQVRGDLRTYSFGAALPASSSSPSASASASAIPSAASSAINSSAASSSGTGGLRPSQPLVGCVLRVTGGAKPTLVERAFYQDKPAYVIAVPSKAWVVGLGCTASDPKLVTSVALTGTP